MPSLHLGTIGWSYSFWKGKFYPPKTADSGVALAWADSPFMAEIGEVTADFLYMRWEDDRKNVKGTSGKIEVNKNSDLQRWADRIKPFIAQKTPVFGYFGKYYSGYPP